MVVGYLLMFSSTNTEGVNQKNKEIQIDYDHI